MDTLTDTQWGELDTLLYGDELTEAAQKYGEMTGADIETAMGEIAQREGRLRREHPERFKTRAQIYAEARAQGLERLEKIAGKIMVIEARWDDDIRGWFMVVSAITKEPSVRHPKYTEHPLCQLRGWADVVERASVWGKEFARLARVDFYLTSADTMHFDDEKRWWDTQ